MGQSGFERFWLFSGGFFPGRPFAVDYLDQAEPAGGRCRAGHQPVFRFEDFLHPLRRPFAPAYFDQRADDDPHHVFEEPTAIDRDADIIVLLHNGQPVEFALGRMGGTAGCLKRFEIVLSDQIPRGLAHGGYIQNRDRDVVRLPAIQRRGVIPIENGVPVGFAGGGYLRVEIRLGLCDLFDHDIGRKQAVHGLQKLVQFHGRIRLKMSHLPFRMHPGIGSARADHPDLFSGDFVQFALQNPLDTHLIDLELPAVVAGAFVFQ